MKANEVPEKIYLTKLMLFAAPTINSSNNDIEYIRKDSFIEKACEWLDGIIYDYIKLEHSNVDTFLNVDNEKFIEDFKKAMKQ